ncbi:MAG TPA: GNAT family N-acetyltransferase [Ktedonobacteraceae bacterium]
MIIRKAHIDDNAGIARVHVDTWRTTYRGIIPDEHLANMTYSNHKQRWTHYLTNNTGGFFTYIAEDDSGQIFGFVSGGYERNTNPIYKGELYLIYILKEYQGQGIGRLLTQTLIKKLLQEGINSMMLWVFADNYVACSFYEVLGGQRLKTKQAEFGGHMLDEVAYGWMDIRKLLQDQYA